MLASYILYVIELEDDVPKFFIYCTETDDKNKVMMECELLFDFPHLYKPKSFVEQRWNIDMMDVDKCVKKYMLKYGIENVRGGTYQSVVLTKEQIHNINTEFEYFEQFKNEKEMRYFLYSNIHETSKDDMADLTNQIISLNVELHDKLNKLKQLEMYQTKTNESCPIKPIMINIETILNTIASCYLDEEYTEDKIISIKDIYKCSLPGLKYMLHLAPTIDPTIKYDTKYKELEPYLIYPEFLLDDLIFHSKNNNVLTDEKKILLQTWCNIVSGILFWFKNRIDELMYDLNVYPSNIEWKLQTICRKLDHTPRNANV